MIGLTDKKIVCPDVGSFLPLIRYIFAALTTEHKQLLRDWAVVVAQLVERLFSIPTARGSNPVIGKKIY